MKKICSLLLWPILFLALSNPTVGATVLYEEDTARIYVNKELGFQLEVPTGWTYETSGKVIEESRERAREMAATILGLSKEEVTQADLEGAPKGILIKMTALDNVLPASQIVTRDLTGIKDAPTSPDQNLRAYMYFVSNATYVDILEPVSVIYLNEKTGAHVAYETQMVLEGETYRTRSDVYSFLVNNHSIDMTIIRDLDSYFLDDEESSIDTLIESIKFQS